MLAMSWLRRTGAQMQGQGISESEQRQRIVAAIPTKAFVTPRKSRRLLIFDLNVNYGGHASIRTSNVAFALMGVETGAFETEISHDPAVFAPDSLKRFDAVFFNNTVGNLFEDPALRQSLVEFVYAGGGLMGVHGTSVAFMKWPGAIEDWPEFGIMLGARGANHKANDEHVFIKLDDPTHPIVQPFGGDFDYRDEFFRIHEPYSRNRVRVLLSIDTAKTDMTQTPSLGKVERADNDYALAWVRQYGRGRVFYCGFAHHPSVFWDPKMLQFYLAATQFALGDLPAPTTPSVKLTPAVGAQEKLGWRLGLIPSVSPKPTLFETIDKAAELGLLYVGSRSGQKVSSAIQKDFDEQLSNDDMRQIRLKLDASGVRLLMYRMDRVPSSEIAWRPVLGFARRMGIETIDIESLLSPVAVGHVTRERLAKMYDPTDKTTAPEFLGKKSPVEKLCDEYAIHLAGLEIDGASLWPRKDIVSLEASSATAALGWTHQYGRKPVMFSAEFRPDKSGSMSELRQIIKLFNEAAVRYADGGES